MRPPASNLEAEESMAMSDVTSPSLTLNDVGDWRNLTTDTSIQIAHLGDFTFNSSQGLSNCLRHVETIQSGPIDLSTRHEPYKCAKQTARTLVSLDSLATTSGRLLDSRLIFSSSRDNGKTSVSRKRTSKSFKVRSQRPASLSPTTSDKLWHSDSELYYPPGECMHMESKSVEDLSNISTDLLVMPLEAVMNSTKVSEIKTVPLLESESQRETSDSETNEDEANNSYVLATSAGIKPRVLGNKMYRKFSNSLRRKRKTLSNIKYLNEIFKSKDAKPETNSLNLTGDKCTKSEGVTMITNIENDKTYNDRKRHMSFGSNTMSLCAGPGQERSIVNHETKSQEKRRPVLGVRMRRDEKLILDELDLDFVCSVKRRLSTSANMQSRKNLIKTNGSLGLKHNTCRMEKVRCESPKRISNRRCGASVLRQNTKCLVSTV